MQKKEDRLEVFKSALISTIKSISEKKDCEIKFGKSNLGDGNKVVNLPELNRINSAKDFSLIRARADSEALRLKYSNNDIFEEYKPKGEMSKKLYKIAEKIRYEKIGSEKFLGIKKNLFSEYKENKKNSESNKSKLTDSFDEYLKSFFFNIKETKKSKINFNKNFKKNLNFLKNNIKDQRKFNSLIAEMISELNIEDKEHSEDREESDKDLKNQEKQERKDEADSQLAEKEENQELSVDTMTPDTKDMSGEDDKSI